MVKALMIGLGAILLIDGLIEALNTANTNKAISIGKGILGAGIIVANIREQ